MEFCGGYNTLMAKKKDTQAGVSVQTGVSKEGTAGQRRAAARAQRAQQKRRQMYALIGVVIVAALLVVAVIAASNRPVEVTLPADLSHYDDVPASVTDEGWFRLGDPDAPVVMEEFSSFSCTYCADYHKTMIRLIDPYVKEGTLSVVFAPMANTEVASLASQAALCAGQQEPAMFWKLHDVFFSWLSTNNYPYSQRQVEAAANELGVDVGAMRACLGSQGVLNALQAVIDEATIRGVTGTPAVFFNRQRPDCGIVGDLCEGNLPYDMVVRNIEQHLAGR